MNIKQQLQGAGITTIAIGAILAVLFFSGVFDSCQRKADTAAVQQVDENAIRREAADSVRAIYAKAEKKSLDSLAKVGQRKISTLNRELGSLRAKAAENVQAYQKDTAGQSASCDSVIVAYKEYSDSLNVSIRVRDELLTVKDSTIRYWTAQYWASENNYQSAKADISDLRKQLVPHTNWWARNSKWIYIGAGFVGGVLLMK